MVLPINQSLFSSFYPSLIAFLSIRRQTGIFFTQHEMSLCNTYDCCKTSDFELVNRDATTSDRGDQVDIQD